MLRFLRPLGLILFIAGASLVGCGGSSDGGGPSNENNVSKRVADAFCAALEPCCQDTGFSKGSCSSLISASARSELARADSDNYDFDANAADQCLRDIESAEGCLFGGASTLGPNTEACNDIYRGKLSAGDACESDIECADGADCEDGVCGGGRAAAGEACTQTCSTDGGTEFCIGNDLDGPRCFTSDGLYCGDAEVCEEQAPLGGDCTGDSACREGNRCISSVCETPRGQGESCFLTSECADDLYCASGSCAPRLGEGESCSLSDRCADGLSCNEGSCQPDDGGIFGTLFCSFGSF